MKNLGWVNGWKEVPIEVKKCKELKHDREETTIGRCLTKKECPICGYFYKVDSSD